MELAGRCRSGRHVVGNETRLPSDGSANTRTAAKTKKTKVPTNSNQDDDLFGNRR